MAQVESSSAMLDAAGVPLKVSLARAERRNRLRALALVLPLLAFILVTFVYPIALMVYRGVDNPTVSEILPETAELLRAWEGGGLPGDEIYDSMAREFATAAQARTLGKVATRLNYELAGSRSLVTKSGRKLRRLDTEPTKQDLVAADKRWNEPKTWAVMKRLAEPYTLSYYLAAIDKTYDIEGAIVDQPESRQIYVPLFLRTLWVSLLITVLCILLAYPIAYLMAILPTKTSNLLMILVLLPFWTSLLVRTSSWIVLLQTEGVLNDILVWVGIISDEGRIQMIYNMTGTVVAMVHILLPFMVLPLFSVMKTISPTYMRAAKSLGATPARAFWTVYFPQTIPGIGAGSILVFILAIGYYITPALVGGRTGQLISNFIAYHMQQSLNWGLAAALGGILLAGVLALYWIYNRLVGIDNMKLG